MKQVEMLTAWVSTLAQVLQSVRSEIPIIRKQYEIHTLGHSS